MIWGFNDLMACKESNSATIQIENSIVAQIPKDSIACRQSSQCFIIRSLCIGSKTW